MSDGRGSPGSRCSIRCVDTPDTVLVRATVSLQGLPVGSTAVVSPRDPYISDLIESKILVPLESSETDDGDAVGPPVGEV